MYFQLDTGYRLIQDTNVLLTITELFRKYRTLETKNIVVVPLAVIGVQF